MLKHRLGTMLEKKGKNNEGQAGFRPNRICRYHVRTLGKIIQGRKDARLTTQCVFLDVQKANDTVVRRNELWKSCEKAGIKGKMWRMVKKMAECAESVMMLYGETWNNFDIMQGVAQRCTLSPTFIQGFYQRPDISDGSSTARIKVGDVWYQVWCL